MSETVIRVEKLGKRYRIGAAQKKPQSGREALLGLVKSPFRYLERALTPPREDEVFWALRNVSFEVKRGEVLGIIGRNGAGKSTLLKILSRITEPTEGRAELHGRVGSLLEVGVGFNPELTGRENIYLNGAILGMSRADIRKRFDEIVAFSEVEKFLDTPVKHYSSGMYVRLAFAVAAHLEPEILVVDEVLAVGDAAFQKKCLGKMGEVGREGRTVLFVSHNMTAVQSLCSRCVRLEKGGLTKIGSAEQVVSDYLREDSRDQRVRTWSNPKEAPRNQNVRLLSASITVPEGNDPRYLTVHTPINLVFRVLNQRPDAELHFNALVYNVEQICVFNTASERRKYGCGVMEAVCRIPGHFLNDSTYTVWFLVHYLGPEGISVRDVLTFEVHDVDRGEGSWYGKWTGVVRPDLKWSVTAPETTGGDAHE